MPDNGHQYTPGSIGSNSLLEPVDPGVYWCPLSGLLQNCSWRGHICLAWPATTTTAVVVSLNLVVMVQGIMASAEGESDYLYT